MSPLPDEVDHAVTSYLVAAYRPGASDIDLIAVLSNSWDGLEEERRGLIRCLRLLHLSQVPRVLSRTVRGRGFSATCNTSFLWDSERHLPVTRIRPVASHVGHEFNAHEAFDVNPVIWHELATGGITVRGKDITEWNIDPEEGQLLPWIRQNLRDYWEPLAQRVNRGLLPLPAHRVEWCLLGPARMHATLTTGEIISKDAAGEAMRAIIAEMSAV